MLLKIAIAAGLLLAGTVAATAETSRAQSKAQAKTMKAKLAAPAGVRQPTGVEVPGCTWYTLDHTRGAVEYCSRESTRVPRRFWADQDRTNGGSAGAF